MKMLIKRLRYIFTNYKDIDQLIKQEQQRAREKEFEENRHRLKLCFKHRQEPNRSHYSEKNCDHCRILERIRREVDHG